jgi:hypothetical protein
LEVALAIFVIVRSKIRHQHVIHISYELDGSPS